MNTDAVCPGCCGNLTWSWCQDTYKVNGAFCKETIMKSQIHGGAEVTVYQCPECCVILGASCPPLEDHDIISHDSISDVDWEAEENSSH